VRSKADTSQLNRPHGNQQVKVENEKKTKKQEAESRMFPGKSWGKLILFSGGEL